MVSTYSSANVGIFRTFRHGYGSTRLSYTLIGFRARRSLVAICRARIRFLGDYWQSRLSKHDRVSILTPSDTSRSFGVAAFMVDGIPAAELVKKIRAKGIIVQDKSTKYSPFKNAVRVSPGLYTTTAELDRFVDVVKGIVKR